jgi:hypothetical protein
MGLPLQARHLLLLLPRGELSAECWVTEFWGAAEQA